MHEIKERGILGVRNEPFAFESTHPTEGGILTVGLVTEVAVEEILEGMSVILIQDGHCWSGHAA